MYKVIEKIGLILLLSFITGIICYSLILAYGEYLIDEKKLIMNQSTRIVDEDGEFIAYLQMENRRMVFIDEVPKHVQAAFIAVEDNRFYEHSGIDIKAITRAISKDILTASKAEGGSTITQQLAKNVFLSNDKTWLRKMKEAVIALSLNRMYSKQKILEHYLNNIYFGHGTYGIQAAAQFYFQKNVSQLTIEEGALLAALPKAPNHYSPFNDHSKALNRRNLVLSLMHQNKFLTAEQAVQLQRKTINVGHIEPEENRAYLSYVDAVIEEAKNVSNLSYGALLKGGYKIVVPINKQLQEKSYELFQNVTYFPSVDEAVEGALIMYDHRTGGVLAVQGGRNYVAQGVHRVFVKRQPGSTFKPIAVYAPAIEVFNYHPYSLLRDHKVNYDGYIPENYGKNYKGTKTIYDAVTHSDNAPAVWLLQEIGLERGKTFLKRFNIKLKREDQLATALGGITDGISPIELAKAYSAFASEGKMVEPYFISSIYDNYGKLIYSRKPIRSKVISKQTAWYMTKMLEGAVNEGTGKHGDTLIPLAGKTGSTKNIHKQNTVKDAWFVGYTPSVVGAVWMGYDRTDEYHYLNGGSKYPTILFKDLLNEMNVTKQVFQQPKGTKDLEPPIRLPLIEDLKTQLQFHHESSFSVELSWTPSSDRRVHYEVYEIKRNKKRLLAVLKGVGNYVVHNVHLFDNRKYFVVPVNTQTNERGRDSNMASFSLWK